MIKRPSFVLTLACLSLLAVAGGFASAPPGESGKLGEDRVTQKAIESGELSRDEIRAAGLRVFTTLFNKFDGYGDGPMDPSDTVSPGGRPTLQGNGTLLRVNGLDAQGCIECHAIVSAATTPPRLGIGGVGGSNTNAIIMPTNIDIGDPRPNGEVEFNGRFANPPFVFGAGAVELLGKEMTTELQLLKAFALANPGLPVQLETKGVSFGTIVADEQGHLDMSGVEGIDDDLVVRPFGRKGEFFSIRDFDVGALQFHFGMQPVEAVGADVDGDEDGVINEVLVGELSALSVFIATIERPFIEPLSEEAQQGFLRFRQVGCNGCHMPALMTGSTELRFGSPEVPTQPALNTFFSVDLTEAPSSFQPNGQGGIVVPLFADLKRHDMGPDLGEDFAGADGQTNREFTTARLWGIADSAPYLHDGRATTLTEAILLHGGEALEVRDAFDNLADEDKMQLLTFLRSLRTPESPVEDLLNPAGDDEDGDDEGGDDGGDGGNGDDEDDDHGRRRKTLTLQTQVDSLDDSSTTSGNALSDR